MLMHHLHVWELVFFQGIFFTLCKIKGTSKIIKVNFFETHTLKINQNHIGTIELMGLTTQLYAPF